MEVEITTQGWNGNYNSKIKEFNSEKSLSLYLTKINESPFSKLIGIKKVPQINKSYD